MPPKKRARRSTIGAQDDTTPEVACRQSSRSNRGVGGHAAQLQKAGEAIAAPTKSRKGRNDYPELDASDPEENSMAPARLRQGKKSVKFILFYFNDIRTMIISGSCKTLDYKQCSQTETCSCKTSNYEQQF
jgi:hypothetical protein